MNSIARLSLTAVFLFAAIPLRPATGQEPRQQTGGGDVAQGKYIVEGVGMCWRCHSPGGDRGIADRQQWLLGAPIRSPLPDWAVYAPRLAGRPPGTDEQVITLLTTGISRTGKPPRLPMPAFRMNKHDAESVLAYLKSLSK